MASLQPPRFGRCPIRCLVLLTLLLAGTAWADSLDTVADTLRRPEDTPLWEDSVIIVPDTALAPGGVVNAWLLPLAVILATGTAAWLLFTVRSR